MTSLSDTLFSGIALDALRRLLRPVLRPLWHGSYKGILAALSPLGALLAVILRPFARKRSVLHVCYMNHVTHQWVEVLRQHGVAADYFAIGRSPFWNRSDYVYESSPYPFIAALREFFLVWTVLARYEVVHFHFMQTFTRTGWEVAALKRLGRRVVVYWAGCEIRDRERNMALHPACNICEICDYNASICRSPLNHVRRALARRWGDVVLVSTPDLKDFAPEGEHFPFFLPRLPPLPDSRSRWPERGTIRIVHATGHPGIEGSAAIADAMHRLKAKGWPIEYVFLRNVPHARILEALSDADLAIGKMKMGYYANFQIEAMLLGVPAMTWVRPEFMTDELRDSGFIFTPLTELEATLEHYLREPTLLAEKRRLARPSILRLHGDTRLVQQLARAYGWADFAASLEHRFAAPS